MAALFPRLQRLCPHGHEDGFCWDHLLGVCGGLGGSLTHMALDHREVGGSGGCAWHCFSCFIALILPCQRHARKRAGPSKSKPPANGPGLQPRH